MTDADYRLLLETLDKAENGPVIEEKSWDRDYVGSPIRKTTEMTTAIQRNLGQKGGVRESHVASEVSSQDPSYEGAGR